VAIAAALATVRAAATPTPAAPIVAAAHPAAVRAAVKQHARHAWRSAVDRSSTIFRRQPPESIDERHRFGVTRFHVTHKTATQMEVGADFICPACPTRVRGGMSRLAKGPKRRHIVERFP
jgi:hypothetical protein